MSWPYNRQSLVRCCVYRDGFKDTVYCLTEDYLSNYLLSLAPRTGLNTDTLKAQFPRVPPLIWKWNTNVCEANTSIEVSSTNAIWVMYFRCVLILFLLWPGNLGSCNLLTRSISYSPSFLQCSKAYRHTSGWIDEWMDGWMDRQMYDNYFILTKIIMRQSKK